MSKTKELEKPTEEVTVEQAGTREVTAVSDLSELFQEDAGAGMEGVGANDVSIPFLTILQKGSPQVDRANAKYMKDADQGFIMNTVSNELYDGNEGILYIPCGYNKSYVEWTPRDSGGGLVGHHLENDPILKQCTVDDRGRKITPDKNVIIDTSYHFGLLLHEESFPEMSVISMYSTQMKASRNWNTVMKRIVKFDKNKKPYNPASYSHIYKMTTVAQTKDNYSWFGWKIEILGEVENIEIYKMARDFSIQVRDGKVRMSAPPSDHEIVEGQVSEDDKVPF